MIGKSTAYVSHHVQLLELPPHVGQAVEQGRVTDLTSIAGLAKVEKQHPEAVREFLDKESDVTRTAVRNFRASLDAPEKDAKTTPGTKEENQVSPSATDIHDLPVTAELKDLASKYPAEWLQKLPSEKPPKGNIEKYHNDDVPDSQSWRRGMVIVELNGRRGMLRLDKMPKDENHVWIEWEDSENTESEEILDKIVLKAIVSK